MEHESEAPCGQSVSFSFSYVMFSQAFYYLFAGVWPLVDAASFAAVTGPKSDLWLVQILAAVLAVIGSAMLIAAVRRALTPEIATLGIGVSLTLCTADFVYLLNRRIPLVYLADALIEALLLAGWIYCLYRSRAKRVCAIATEEIS